MEKPKINKALIERYYQNQCSEEEVERILEAFDENGEELDAWMFEIWENLNTDFKLNQSHKKTLWKRISSALPIEKQVTCKPATPTKRQFAVHRAKQNFWNYGTRMAASVMMAFGLCWSVWYFTHSHEKLPVLVEKINPLGQKLSLVLPDGTEVKLNGGSTLRYPQEFSDSLRQVELEGEAYFSVVKNRRKPFEIKANNVYTRVLGTEFNVRAYPEDSLINIALVEGKVAVKTRRTLKDTSFLLTPGQLAIYDVQHQQLAKSEFHNKEFTAWKDKILFFYEASFEEILTKLSRWYGVKFELQNPDMAHRYSDKFSGEYQNESLENVLNAISYSKRFQYRIEGDSVFIKFF
ncbi:FecR domain-containing protein [Rapidithrix thailandica]|uniref:FecR domain-containing protein n=1 Tax=Rapidithrix thailandica TaxID=413964 RepID=A0AAW9SA86_9BACT